MGAERYAALLSPHTSGAHHVDLKFSDPSEGVSTEHHASLPPSLPTPSGCTPRRPHVLRPGGYARHPRCQAGGAGGHPGLDQSVQPQASGIVGVRAGDHPGLDLPVQIGTQLMSDTVELGKVEVTPQFAIQSWIASMHWWIQIRVDLPF